MKLLFDDDLVEGTLEWCWRAAESGISGVQVRRFHAERDRCYQVLDPDERGAAFARVHQAWFSEWGWESRLQAIVDRFPHLEPALAALAFRKARGREEEGSELYGAADGRRHGVMALRPEGFADWQALTRMLHHELGHLSDMVDPLFGYAPNVTGLGGSASHQRLVRERYRLLWDVSIDGRLVQRELATVSDEARRHRELDRGFGFLSEGPRSELFASLWSGRLARHDAFLKLALDPRGLGGRHAPVPGASCPMCGFPTFAWTFATGLSAVARGRMRAEFPSWEESESVCSRCAEMYEAITQTEYPSTVCL